MKSFIGTAGQDQITGTIGDDFILGGAGNDTIKGGAGNDVIDGSAGADVLVGGEGDDAFMLSDNFGNGTITGGETGEIDGDLINLSALTSGVSVTLTGAEAGAIQSGSDVISFAEIEEIFLTDQADTLDATAVTKGIVIDGAGGDDILGGDAGNDLLYGGEGGDSILGHGDNDSIYGGDGSDTLGGMDDHDLLSGGADNEQLYGGDGNDTPYSDDGDDALYGGAGSDVFTIDTADLAGEMTIIGGNEDQLLPAPGQTTSGDVLDLRGLADVSFVHTGIRSGRATYQTALGQQVVIHYTEIATILADIAIGGPLDGTEGNDNMGVGYRDIHGDQIDGHDGPNDMIFAGGGNDKVNAGIGDDVIYG